jgi:hypothetical protein
MSPNKRTTPLPEKFTRFTFRQLSDEETADALFRSITTDLAGRPTVLDLMSYYARETREDCSTESPYFAKLQKIFGYSITPRTMAGYFHGAALAFRNEGLLNLFNLNTLNCAWPIARFFSPWTGKTFDPIAPAKLSEMTGGFETGATPTVWGSNTYRSRRLQEKMAVDVMRRLDIWLEDATPDERKSRDYDVKGFFFIGREGSSVNPANRGRTVYQFNYRWPSLKTFPPDNYCVDEIVQVADGLYLGQLLYATNLHKEYSPSADPAEYCYGNFGYFLIMDEDWQQRRVKIRFEV